MLFRTLFDDLRFKVEVFFVLYIGGNEGCASLLIVVLVIGIFIERRNSWSNCFQIKRDDQFNY